MRVLVLLALFGGCDKLFDLDLIKTPIDPTGDGGTTSDGGTITDGRLVDAAAPCLGSPITHDEDGDSRDDSCDLCPTIASDELDADGDGLPNACDPNLSTTTAGDRILLATTLATYASFSDHFTDAGALHNAANKGSIYLGSGTRMETRQLFLPTKIELKIAGIGGGGLSSALELQAIGISCAVAGAKCDGTNFSTNTCLTLGIANGDYAGPGTSVRLVEMFQSGPTTMRCAIFGIGAGGVNIATVAAFENGQLTFRTTGFGDATINSIVFYGAK